MKCNVCGMDVDEQPKAEADDTCEVCGRKMVGDRRNEQEE